MADESIDLRFLAEQGKRILDELAEARAERAGTRAEIEAIRAEQKSLVEIVGKVAAEQKSLAAVVGKVVDAVTTIAARQDHHTEVLARHSELLGQILETQQNYGARLNAIDGRLAIIERHTGLVKA
jgi:seryl-tRNA synthetase